ncbi:hypothetical protein BCR37DRAFT_230386 [Protomyces lactucae-debilis]|uniref:Uncharacterized protein n=1 Tax=Protomyces lactucae-debilis TaxID=2754530 RepID=A0A1Y2EQ00_PROLT|nr:uncharacterized protein BCR37DRAFT_230386 [Protomyces lactucae-debilis]ORY73670.1 hypothetical protein BCR37DRAFT_230386 [Protomyces lactucae-debilis]
MACYYVAEDTACSTKPDDFFTAKDSNRHGKGDRLGIYCGYASDLNTDHWVPKNAKPGYPPTWGTRGKHCDVIFTYRAPVNAAWLVLKPGIQSEKDLQTASDCPYQLKYQVGPYLESKQFPMDTKTGCYHINKDDRCGADWFTVTANNVDHLGVYCAAKPEDFIPKAAFAIMFGWQKTSLVLRRESLLMDSLFRVVSLLMPASNMILAASVKLGVACTPQHIRGASLPIVLL